MSDQGRRRILVVDDQIGKPASREMEDFLTDYKDLRDRYEFIFEDCDDGRDGYSSEEAIQAIIEAGQLDLVLLDIKFGSESDRLGFEILERIRSQFRGLPVVMMTSLKRDVDSLTKSLEPGAVSYISKRPNPLDLEKYIETAISLSEDYAILGRSSSIRRLRREIARISPYDNVPVMILGERGTGKERVARQIHQNCPHSDGPFIGLNCAGLSSELLDSELFGHIKGSFTNADRDRKGYLEVAAGGTLFLDEFGEIPVRIQVKLLRVLEEKKFYLVGDSEYPKNLNVQILSATNKDPQKLIQEGKLREDFYDRIAAFIIRTPRLIEYSEDIPELVTYFLQQTFPGRTKRFTSGALKILQRYSWPGNGRELKNIVWRSAIKSGDSPIIGEDCLPEEISRITLSGNNLENKGKSLLIEDLALPENSYERADFFSKVILDIISIEAKEVEGNAAAIMRDLFPGQNESKRYLGQVAWKLVDWNPKIIENLELRVKFEGCDVLWSAFLSYLKANTMAKRKLWDKLRRSGIEPPDISS